jgi:hypothetical protein
VKRRILHMRHIVLHYHIYKNAGSSIDSILRYNFRDSCGSIEGNYPWDTLDSATILRFAQENPNLKVISSHQARLPQPVDSNIIFYPLIFLRHPIDRIGSVYSFERREPLNSRNPGAKIARENDLAGYVKWRLSHGAVIKNFQTIFLSGREKDMRTATATKAELDIAQERIKNLDFFGIVELFEDSMLKMKHFLTQRFGNINTPVISIENKSCDRKSSIEERIREIQLTLGIDLYTELLEKNALDLELYNNALSLFQSRFKHDEL